MHRAGYLIVLGLGSLAISTCLDSTNSATGELTLSPLTATIGLGDTIRMSATFSDAGGSVPSRATWTSSAPDVASVDQRGLVKGISLGAVRIRAESQRLSAEGTIAVLPPLRLVLNRNVVRLLLRDTVRVFAVALNGRGDTMPSSGIFWSSSASEVASVDTAGLIRSHDFGVAQITASTGAISTNALVEVSPIVVLPDSMQVVEGDTVTFRAIVVDSLGDTVKNAHVQWSISDAMIASIDSNGKVQAAVPGEASVRASIQNSSSHGTLNVQPAIFVGAGDIATCTATGDDETAKLLDHIPGQVFTAGDNAYPSGSLSDYVNCFDPTWGRHKARMHPTPGNHEYEVPNGPGYFPYFGAAAGDSGKGYYSFNLGAWHLIALNSSIDVSTNSPQLVWLRADLAAHPNLCTLAYFHYALFSSGAYSVGVVRTIWNTLYASGVDVVVSGHDHMYERFAPQSPAGVADPLNGIRQFTVGTGGRSHFPVVAMAANSEVQNSDTWGVLKLTLHPTSYSWEFVPVAGATFTDSGTSNCH